MITRLFHSYNKKCIYRNFHNSSEFWLPLAGGGLANVSIRKRPRLPPDVGGHEYIIYGQRISDQTVSEIFDTHTHTHKTLIPSIHFENR